MLKLDVDVAAGRRSVALLPLALLVVTCVLVGGVMGCEDRSSSDTGEVASPSEGTGSEEQAAAEAEPQAEPPPTMAQVPPPEPDLGDGAALGSAPHGHAHHAQMHGEHGMGHGVPEGALDEHGMAHDFSNADRWAEVFDDPERDVWQMPTEVVGVMNIEPGMRVADIGAGTGYFEPHLAAAVGDDGVVEALDIEENLVAYMQERFANESLTNVVPRLVQPDDPQLEPGGFDRVITVNTWHHVGDRPGYAAKVAEGLAPGGAFYVVDYTLESPMGPPADHRLPPEAVIEELVAGGLEASIVEEPLPHQYIVVGRKP